MSGGAARATGIRTEPAPVRWLLIAAALAFLTLFLLVPLAAVFAAALEQGWQASVAAALEPEALSSLKLTLIAAAVSLPLNTIFGVAAAWAIARYRFAGRHLLISLIDLPFAISPVVAGLVFVLLFGSRGVFGPWLTEHDIRIIFAVPGVLIATMFVTVPFVARELIPLMQEQGDAEELAAISLGATGWQMFRIVTLPKIKWGLVYGIILLNARAIGEFGAVSVVSGHVRGLTNTAPLHVEILYNEYNFVGAFTVAAILAMLALVTVVLRAIVEWRLETPGKDRS